MTCEMCGKQLSTWPHEIEGVKMDVCPTCGKFGKKLAKPKKVFVRKVLPTYTTNETNERIVSNFAEIIRNTRSKSSLKQEEFAKKINEKASVVQHIETGKMKPSVKLAKKLEKIFNITLIEEETTKKLDLSKFKNKSSTLTLGDMIKRK